MIFKITKTNEGLIDTSKERRRIQKAFKNSPTVRKKLTKFMDAIESQKWELAKKMLEQKWWQKDDKRRECSRYEFVGLINVKDVNGQLPAYGFDGLWGYDGLVYVMCRKDMANMIKLEKLEGTSKQPKQPKQPKQRHR